jgi:preprotein translocase subunit SecG
MNQQKKIWVSFLVIASVLVLAGAASASPLGISYGSVKVNDIVTGNNSVSVIAGDTIPVVVTFTSNVNASNVRLSITTEGAKVDVEKEVFVGDVENGQTYTKSLTLQVPYELQDAQSGNLNLVVKMWNGDFSGNIKEISLRVQRPSYNAEIMSLSTVDSATAGQLVPVDVVIKNTGYNQLNDLYVTLKVPELGLQRTAYFGDLVAIGNTDNPDTASGRIFLQIPSNAKSGTYTIEVQVENGDFSQISTTPLTITNDFESNVIASNSELTAGVGEDVTYALEIVNPTNEIKVYTIVPQTLSGVKMSTDSMVTVPAGLSRTVLLNAKATSEGNYNLSVNVFSGQELTGNVNLALNAAGGVSNPVVVLTIVLAIIFVALLVVLLVLVTKKPKKQEEFEESYY